jgi:hypothetical protein
MRVFGRSCYLFAYCLLYIAKHPENFTHYCRNKNSNLMPFYVSIFYGYGSCAIPYQQAFCCFIILVITTCHK